MARFLVILVICFLATLSFAAQPDVYEVKKGDTLASIAKTLFGNPKEWKKILALNPQLKNPNILKPGMKLYFDPGTAERLPELKSEIDKKSRIQEFDKIPTDWWKPKDPKEFIKDNYDEHGIDKDIKLSPLSRFQFRVPTIANDSKFPFLAEIVASKQEGVGLTQHEIVFIRSKNQDLQVGATYSVLEEPESIRERRSDRTAFVYRSLGEIRILGIKDELYVGKIDKAYDVIKRGDRLYPLLPLISEIEPTPAVIPLEALIFFSRTTVRNTSQFHFVQFDRGLEDGVKLGNVFRVYDYYDPLTTKKITDSDVMVNADAIVVHVTSQFSTALVIRAKSTFTSGDFGVLLTDISDLEKEWIDRSKSLDADTPVPEDKELDELDRLEEAVGEGVGRQEEVEIKELESWDSTKDQKTEPSTEPATPPTEEQPLPTETPKPTETLDALVPESGESTESTVPTPEGTESENPPTEPVEPPTEPTQ